MKLIVFVCLIGLIWADPASQTTAMDAFKNIKNALIDFGDAFKQCAPLAKFHVVLEDYIRTQKGYSSAAGLLVGQLKTMLLNVDSDYFNGKQFLNGVCSETVPLFEGYVQMFDDYSPDNADAQKELMQSALKATEEKLSKASSALQQTHSKFNDSCNRLDDLIVQLTKDYTEDSDYYKSEIEAAQAEAVLELVADAPLTSGGQNKPKGDQKPLIPSLNDATIAEIIAKLKQRFAENKNFFVTLKNRMDEAGKLDFTTIEKQITSEIEDVKGSNVQVGAKGVYAPNAVSAIKNAINSFTDECKGYRKSN